MRVVRHSDYTPEDEKSIRRETAKRLGPDAELRIEYVDALPRSKTGKLRFVVSELPVASIESGQAAV